MHSQILSNASTAPLACLFSGAAPLSGDDSLDIRADPPIAVAVAAEITIPQTGLGGTRQPTYVANGIAWVDNSTAAGSGSVFNSIPANGRFIVAANLIDEQSLTVWFQGVLLAQFNSTSKLRGGYLSAIGARKTSDGSLSNFCGCALHERK